MTTPPASGATRSGSESVESLVDQLSRHGAHGETGVWRTVYSPEWVAAADQFAAWCEEAGLTVRRDAVGNVWGRLEGTEGGPAIVSGSHIDTQRPGGRYDGALGAIAALVSFRTLRERYGRPKRTLEAVALCEEEGSRFPSAGFWGSRAITGNIGPDIAETTIDYDGETIADAMRAVGLDPGRIAEVRRDDIDAFIELHVEQGPILEEAGVPVGVVDAITGMRHYHVELTGTANHAGAFPMDLRRDPMAGAAEIISGVIQTAHRMGRPAVTTVGRMAVEPNGAAIIPERVTFTVDARHPDPETRQLLYARHEGLMREVAARRNLDLRWHLTFDLEPVTCDPGVVATIRDVAAGLGLAAPVMASGAGHDTQRMASICRTAMIFVRSRDGRSHTPEEFSTTDDCVAGIDVLTETLRRLAY